MKRIILGIILALAMVSANATQNNGGDTCNGNGSCSTTTNNTTNNQGGTGGAGGNATVNDNSKTYNTNTNVNANTQGQNQGQLQGQQQGQGQGQSQSTRNSNNAKQSVTVEGDSYSNNYKRSAPGVSAPAVTSTAMCMIGVSGGLSGPIGGLTFGTYTRDEICSFLDTGKAMIQMGAAIGDESMVMRGHAMMHKAADLLEAKYGAANQPKPLAAAPAPASSPAPVKSSEWTTIHPSYSGF